MILYILTIAGIAVALGGMVIYAGRCTDPFGRTMARFIITALCAIGGMIAWGLTP